MGSGRGRPRKPTNIKLAQGTYRADRFGDPTAEANFGTITAPSPPDSLGEHGQAKWNWLTPQLAEAGLLQKVDVAAVEMYCRCFDEIATCDADIQRDGRWQPTMSGGLRAHPAMNERNRWVLLASRYEREFGMTPSSRSGVQVKKPETGGVLARKRG